MDSSTNIPLRFRESAFRKYENALEQIDKRWPQPTVFLLSSMSTETFSARLRDAWKAFIEPNCLWESTLDRDRMRMIWNEKEVRQVGAGKVVVSLPVPRNQTQVGSYAPSEFVNTHAGVTGHDEIGFDQCTTPELRALATLLNNGRLETAFRLTNAKFTDEEVAHLSDEFPNTQIAQQDNGDWIVI